MWPASQIYKTNTVTSLIITGTSLTPELYTSRVSGICIRTTVSLAILFQERENSLNRGVTVDAEFVWSHGHLSRCVFLWGKLGLLASLWTSPHHHHHQVLSTTCMLFLPGPQPFSLPTIFSHFPSLFLVTPPGWLDPEGFPALEMHCSEINSFHVTLL